MSGVILVSHTFRLKYVRVSYLTAWNCLFASGIPRLEGQKTQGAVQALLNEYHDFKAQLQRKEALRLKSPSEKVT